MADPGPAPNHTRLQTCSDSHRPERERCLARDAGYRSQRTELQPTWMRLGPDTLGQY
ncbi:hypothetical protein NQZ68_037013 [Dissostichus eleginoides]|nr:hypothetical protein NQZ68_037013 [Dissostichus eleginoides]